MFTQMDIDMKVQKCKNQNPHTLSYSIQKSQIMCSLVSMPVKSIELYHPQKNSMTS